jgi:predicted ATPase with chaperone activity
MDCGQPLEEGAVTLARPTASPCYPAAIRLVPAANASPRGAHTNSGFGKRTASGLLVDQIDLWVAASGRRRPCSTSQPDRAASVRADPGAPGASQI